MPHNVSKGAQIASQCKEQRAAPRPNCVRGSAQKNGAQLPTVAAGQAKQMVDNLVLGLDAHDRRKWETG